MVDGGVAELEHRLGMQELLDAGPRAWQKTRPGRVTHEFGRVELQAPLQIPGKILLAIVNTQDMLGGKDVTLDRPRLDMKASSTVIGPGQRIMSPESGVRPEVELAAVVGRTAARSTPAEAKKAIFGYMILNDVTSPKDSREDAYEAYRRDQGTGEIKKARLRGPLFRSKNHDTFCPTGPWIVAADELTDTMGLKMTTKFGPRKIQDGSTADYLFTPEAIVSYVSSFLTLEPGDLISCGSVGWTKEAIGRMDPTEYVLPRENALLELEIEGIGALRNPVVYP